MTRTPTATELVLLRLAKDALTPLEWQAWVMVRFLGYSQREVADATSRSPGTVADTLRRAERKIEEAQRATDQGA